MKYRYLILTDGYETFGTNDRGVAEEANEYEVVLDVETGKTLDDEDIEPWEPDAGSGLEAESEGGEEE